MHRFFVAGGGGRRFDDDCRNARIGCVDRKRALAESIIERYGAIAERSRELRENPEKVIAILKEGSRARASRGAKDHGGSAPRDQDGLGVKRLRNADRGFRTRGWNTIASGIIHGGRNLYTKRRCGGRVC